MNIVIAGDFVFPEGSASASRVRHMAKGLAELGNNVYVVTMSPRKSDHNTLEAQVWHSYEGFHYYIAGTLIPPQSRKSFITKVKSYFSAFREGLHNGIKCIDQLHQANNVDAVIGYSYRFFSMYGLIKYCKRKNILVLRDVIEWFDPKYFRGGKFNPLYWDFELNVRFSLPKSDGIIAITKFLEENFLSQGIKVIRIPAIIAPDTFVTKLPKLTTAINDPFQLTYLGGMIERDGPMLMMQAVREVLISGSNVFFNIVGTDGNDGFAIKAKEFACNDPVLKNNVKFWGRLSDHEVVERLFCSDALIFTRLESRDAKASFPTRLPEYLMTGKPVITSGVCDIPEYLIDGREAIIVKPNSVSALADGVKKLLNMPDHGKAIGQAGLKKCKQCFNYRTRCAEINNFLNELISTCKTRQR